MASIVSCPACARALQVPDEYLGQTVQCPECKQTFEAQGSAVSSVASTPPSPPPVPQAEQDLEWEEPPPSKKQTQRQSEPEWEEPPPSKKRTQRRSERAYADDDDDERPIRKPRRGALPGKVQAVAIMTLVGGIVGILVGVYLLIMGIATMGICCLWPGGYYSLVMGIMATIKGSRLLGEDAHRMAPPKGIAVMMIINIVNADIVNCVLGIINLIFLNEPETNEFFRG